MTAWCTDKLGADFFTDPDSVHLLGAWIPAKMDQETANHGWVCMTRRRFIVDFEITWRRFSLNLKWPEEGFYREFWNDLILQFAIVYFPRYHVASRLYAALNNGRDSTWFTFADVLTSQTLPGSFSPITGSRNCIPVSSYNVYVFCAEGKKKGGRPFVKIWWKKSY